MPRDVVVQPPLRAFGEFISGRRFHWRDGWMVTHISASLRISDLALSQEMRNRLAPGWVIRLLSQGCMKIKGVRVSRGLRTWIRDVT